MGIRRIGNVVHPEDSKEITKARRIKVLRAKVKEYLNDNISDDEYFSSLISEQKGNSKASNINKWVKQLRKDCSDRENAIINGKVISLNFKNNGSPKYKITEIE